MLSGSIRNQEYLAGESHHTAQRQQPVRPVGHHAVHAEGDQPAHGLIVIDGPGVHAQVSAASRRHQRRRQDLDAGEALWNLERNRIRAGRGRETRWLIEVATSGHACRNASSVA